MLGYGTNPPKTSTKKSGPTEGGGGGPQKGENGGLTELHGNIAKGTERKNGGVLFGE